MVPTVCPAPDPAVLAAPAAPSSPPKLDSTAQLVHPFQMHTLNVHLAALLEGKKPGKKVNQFLIMPCLLSFMANSAHTKVTHPIKRNTYFKKTHRCLIHFRLWKLS